MGALQCPGECHHARNGKAAKRLPGQNCLSAYLRTCRRLIPRQKRPAACREPHPLAQTTWQQQAASSWRLLALVLASIQLVLGAPALADTSNYTINTAGAEEEEEQYFITVPQDLDSSTDTAKGPRLGSLIEGPKGKQVQSCARKCVPTCIRGGQGAPGLGPMSMRKEIVVFKEGYRTRSYCLSECTQVCALQANGKGESK